MEDYSATDGAWRRAGDWSDQVKHIPLSGADAWYLSLGGQARERYEYFDNYLFGSGTQDDDGYYLTRLTAHADAHLGRNVRVFLELKSAMVDDRVGGPRTSDADEFDVQQAFADVTLPVAGTDVRLRLGRQEMIFGSQRLIGISDWANNRRTFEGFRGTLTMPGQTVDAFLVRPVVCSAEEPNVGDGTAAFWGVYDTISLGAAAGAAKPTLDVYALGLNRTKATAYDTAGAVAVDSDTYTVGARFVVRPKPWDFEAEADYQFGQYNHGNIRAWSLVAEGGYTFATAPCAPRPFVGFDIASGDHDPGDADRQTFNQLFPSGHAFFGYIDAIGRQNIIDVRPGTQLTLLKDRPWCQSLMLRGEYHLFWRQSTADAVYTASGSVLRASGGSSERFVGSELDLLLNWQVDRHLSAYLGYSHFFAGDFIQQTGPSNDVDFAYVAVQYTF